MLSKASAATVSGRRTSRRKFGWSNGKQMFHNVAQPACTTPALFVEPSRSAVFTVSQHCCISRIRVWHRDTPLPIGRVKTIYVVRFKAHEWQSSDMFVGFVKRPPQSDWSTGGLSQKLFWDPSEALLIQFYA